MFKLFFKKTNKNPPISSPECNHVIIGIQDSLININNNIEQIKENNYKESQINWKFILTITPLYFPLLVFFAILIGAFKTHSYLNSIGYIGVFSEIIGNPSTLIGVVVAYYLMVFLLSIYFVLPFFNFMILNHGNQFFNNEEFNHKIKIRNTELEIPRLIFKNLFFYSMVPILLIFWIFCIYFEYNFSEYILWFIFAYCVLISMYFSFKCKDFFNGTFICFTFSFIWLYSYIYPMIHAKIIVSFENRENWQWYIFLVVILIPVFINVLSFFVLKSQKKLKINKKRDDIFMGILSVLLSLLLSFILTITTKFSDLSLYVPRFIEKPQDSSWYLIHNGNTTSDTINGMTKDDIKARQKDFNTEDKNCSTEKLKKQCKQDYFDVSNRDNALYGYMAWNLGSTKVFCPVSVDFFDDKDNTAKSKKCLVIDGKYLQMIDKKYLLNL